MVMYTPLWFAMGKGNPLPISKTYFFGFQKFQRSGLFEKKHLRNFKLLDHGDFQISSNQQFNFIHLCLKTKQVQKWHSLPLWEDLLTWTLPG